MNYGGIYQDEEAREEQICEEKSIMCDMSVSVSVCTHTRA
jgi:hypothetical protein